MDISAVPIPSGVTESFGIWVIFLPLEDIEDLATQHFAIHWTLRCPPDASLCDLNLFGPRRNEKIGVDPSFQLHMCNAAVGLEQAWIDHLSSIPGMAS